MHSSEVKIDCQQSCDNCQKEFCRIDCTRPKPDDAGSRRSIRQSAWNTQASMPHPREMPPSPLERLGIETLDGLKRRLAPRDTILCLGNGPSSEDPRLLAEADATLFRVNWIWAERSWLDAPDLVLTGDPDLVRLDRQPVIVFPNRETGEPVLQDHLSRGCLPDAGFVLLDRFTPMLADLSGPQIPTNGALMVALAVALRPKRIVIAGIDLYRHPRGKYPGAPDEPVGYTSQHSVEIDLDLIGRALGAFEGETIILSENLHDALGRA